MLHYLISTIVTHRQEALLAAISEKDANIALLELSSSKKKKTQEEVAQLRREKDRLVQQLKQQVRTASQGSDRAYLSVLKVKLFVCFKFRVAVEHKRPRQNTSLFWLVGFWMQTRFIDVLLIDLFSNTNLPLPTFCFHPFLPPPPIFPYICASSFFLDTEPYEAHGG